MNFNAVKGPRPINNKLQNREMPPCLSLRLMLETSSITFVNVARALFKVAGVSTREKGWWWLWVGCIEFWKIFYIKIWCKTFFKFLQRVFQLMKIFFCLTKFYIETKTWKCKKNVFWKISYKQINKWSINQTRLAIVSYVVHIKQFFKIRNVHSTLKLNAIQSNPPNPMA